MTSTIHDYDADDIDLDREGDEVDEEQDDEFEDESAAEEERLQAVEQLELLMGDAQGRMSTADAGDLDPAEAYRIVFEGLGWTEAEIDEGIKDADRSLEGQLYDHVGSEGYAKLVLRAALAIVEARMLESVEAPSPSP